MSKAMEERINREKDKERIDCSYEYIKKSYGGYEDNGRAGNVYFKNPRCG